jgi:ATP-dependent helicase HrpB
LRNETPLTASALPREQPLALALCAALARHGDAVLQAPTGAGKSTIVPLALLEEDWLADRKILMLEPRRLAARAVAARMAALRGESVGQTIGYRMRFDTRVSRATRIEVLTEGVLARLLQEDPALEGVGCVIFDEFHERSLQADLGLALCLDARRQLGSSFRLIIMSATLEGERITRLLGDAALVQVPGRAFPVTVQYLGNGAPLLPAVGPGPDAARDAQRLTGTVVRAVQRALEHSSGGVLVFLPGSGEIRRVEAGLAQAGLPSAVRVLSLYGQMASAAQDAVLTPAAPGIRKVVLATNLAETSLTIPDVTAVVDSGLVRRSHFDPVTGMSRLDLERISRAASEQRCGRAGRVAPGICYRLWGEGAQASLAATTTPEILEADLAPLALELALWGASDTGALEWLDAPPAPMLQQGRALLTDLGALDAAGRLMARGRDMARLPVHPRLGAMLLAAQDAGTDAVGVAARLAAVLSERDLLPYGTDAGARDPDIGARLELLHTGAARGRVDRAALERVSRTARALEAAVQRLNREQPPSARGGGGTLPASDAVGALLAHGFSDRIGQRREGAQRRYLLSNGRGALFDRPSAIAHAAFIVAVELDDREREAKILLAAPLSRETLERIFASRISAEQSFGWDSRAAAVLGRRVRRLGALVLEEHIQAAAPGAETVAAMLEGVREMGLAALPWDRGARLLQARMQFVRSLGRAELADWPASDDATLSANLEQWLPAWLAGLTRREHLERLRLSEALRARLSGEQRRALEALAPSELTMPSGQHVQVDYLDDNAPCVAVRLQEVFGLDQTPRIGGGAVAVTFKLLSPAQRPLQITRDLAGFWRSSYAEVRKAMRGRYPKHAWPENPLEAAPMRGPKRSHAKRGKDAGGSGEKSRRR